MELVLICFKYLVCLYVVSFVWSITFWFILTDFSSSAGDDLSRQEFVKDLGSAMSGSFDTDLLPSDEMLREGLVPIDFDGLQMLTDPDMNVITDPATEDNFRLDKL